MTTRTTSARRSHAASPSRTRSVSPAIPRRVSGPVARPVTAEARTAAATGAVAAGARPLSATRPRLRPLQRLVALPDHPLLDRLLRGRLWICMIGILLGGIVAMQVSLLKLNTGISRAVQTASTLEQQNSSLEMGVARLSSRERIERSATARGMGTPEAGDTVYVRARGDVDGRRAVNRMSEPSAQARAMLAGPSGAASETATTSTPVTTAPVTEVAAPPAVAPSAVAPAPATTAVAPAAAPPVAPAITAPVATAPVADAASAPQG